MLRYIFFLVLIAFALQTRAQQSEVFAGVQVPLFYTVGYQQKLNNHFTLTGQVGILTSPFNVALMNIMKQFDANEVLVNTIGNAFSMGINIQPTLKWHFNHFYIGVSYSWLRLTAKDSPSDLIQSYYGISLPSLWEYDLKLKSDLHNAGLVFGREFFFKKAPVSIHLDLMVLKTFASKSYLENSTDMVMSKLSDAINQRLNYYYIHYGFLPSLNLTFAYKFGTQQ
jgi:hypothetical protein